MSESKFPIGEGLAPREDSAPGVRRGSTPGARVPRVPQFRSRTIARMITEIVVVVLGILIAFGLDAWWDRQASLAREEAHLRALASDFEQNVLRLREHVEGEERVSSSSLQLLMMARRTQSAPRDSVTRLLGRVFSSARYEPVLGAYEALVNSAGLTAIGDDSLRAALAEFSARVSGRYFERYSDELYFSFIREFAGQLRFFAVVDTTAADSGSYTALLSDPRFQEYLALRHLSERDAARSYRELLVLAEAIRNRIGIALD